MNKSIRVLLVEDNENDAQLILMELRRNGYDPQWTRVQTSEEMQKALHAQEWDIILSDYSMPTFSGHKALLLLKESGKRIPFIMLSGTITEESAVESLKAGAHDFIVKGKLTRLLPAIERELQEANLRKAHNQMADTLKEKEHRLHQIFESEPQCVQILDKNNILLEINPAGLSLIEVSSVDEVIGTSVLEYILPEHHGKIQSLTKGVFQGESGKLQYAIKGKKGTHRWLETHAVPLRSNAGNITELLAITRDITEQKNAEEKIRQQLQRLEALHNIDIAITGSMDMKVTLKIVLDQVINQLRIDSAVILILNPTTQILNHYLDIGFRSINIRKVSLRIGEGLAGKIVLNRTTQYVNNLNNIKDFIRAPLLKEEQFVSYFGIPLIAKGQVKGVLEIFHRKELKPDNDWINYMNTLAGQAAIAIDNSILFEGLQRSNIELIRAYDTTLEGWSNALDLRDKETEGHTKRVTEVTLQLARIINYPDGDLIHIRRGALLHDIGKMGIPDNILLKPGPLTDEEWVIMRKHPVYAFELLSPIEFLRNSLDIPYCHHEKWNGTGYPRGLKGEQIPHSARIFAIVDVWDALNSDRPYRKAWLKDKIEQYIISETNTQFDPQIAKVFLETFLHRM